MQLEKPTTPKRIKTLHCLSATLLLVLLIPFTPVSGQDNSPYSRYGIGDLVPSTHVNTRAMAGISAGYSDYLSINFNNPASYANFEANPELRSKRLSSGRTILDVGINMESRVLREANPPKKFTAGNLLFSYVQVGIPIRKGWGLNFGLRPISRVSYKVFRSERLKDPNTGQDIDSATTRFEGDGGSYLASLGTGFNLFKKKTHWHDQNLSIGVNAGYLFGEKDNSSRREFRNDTVLYYSGNFQTRTNYGNIYMNAGLQYRLPLKRDNLMFSAGIYGNWSQKMRGRQDKIRETFVYDVSLGDLRLDSVQDIKDVKGTVILPSTFSAGFVLQKYSVFKKESGWLIGVDVVYQGWNKYRFYDQQDSVENKLELRVGGQLNPVPRENYFSRVSYRWGVVLGPDYIKLGKKIPQLGLSMGMGLPVGNYNRLSPNQVSVVNLAFEFIKRGNNNNLLKENLFRVSAGFSLSDIWFIKRKYD